MLLNATVLLPNSGTTFDAVRVNVHDDGVIDGSLILDEESTMVVSQGVVTGNVQNAGLVAVRELVFGSGMFEIQGDFTQLATGSLIIGVGVRAEEFDFVTVGGEANLDGALIAFVETGFLPTFGDPDLLFIVTEEVSGQFSSVDADEYIVVQTANGLVLRVPALELAGAQLFEEDSTGQVVAANLQLAVVPSEESSSEFDEFFADGSEFDFGD